MKRLRIEFQIEADWDNQIRCLEVCRVELIRCLRIDKLGISDFVGADPKVLSMLRGVRSEEQVNDLLSKTNEILRSVHESGKGDVKWVRQRIYDHRKRLRKEADATAEVSSRAPLYAVRQEVNRFDENQLSPSAPITDQDRKGFLDEVCEHLASLDGKSFARNFPSMLFLSISVVAITAFLVDQTIPLYRMSGYDKPTIVAIAAVLMGLGFAGVNALKRGRVYPVMLLFALGYEGAFVVSGTIDDETSVHKASLLSEPELLHAKDLAAQASEDYSVKKERYEDPNNKVYRNSWYFNTYLKPALERKNESMVRYLAMVRDIESRKEPLFLMTMNAWLKLILRLGMVILNIVLTHILITKVFDTFRFSIHRENSVITAMHRC